MYFNSMIQSSEENFNNFLVFDIFENLYQYYQNIEVPIFALR